MSNLPDWKKKIQDYYAGRLSPEEKAELLQWMHKKKVITLGTARSTGWYWKAACVAAMVGIGGWLVSRYSKSNTKTAATIASLHYHTVKVEDGNRSRLVLPDGSVITFNGGSTLSIPDQFASDSREIYLNEGEAYFEVAKDVARPFIVHSTNMDIHVLGTSFSVRDYGDERNAETGVTSGKIAVTHAAGAGPAGDALYLLPGDKVILNKAQSAFMRQNTDTSAVAAWIRGELVFQGATLHHVLNVLKHRYAVSFDVKRPDLEEEKFSATFRNNSLETILEQLKLMSGLQYNLQGKTILIHKEILPDQVRPKFKTKH